MKNLLLLIVIFIIGSAAACNEQSGSAVSGVETVTTPSAKKMLKDLDGLEKKLRNAKQVTDEMPAAGELVKLSQDFFENYPEHPKTADVLFKGADVARGIGMYGKAVQLWGFVRRNYPDYPRAPDALFMQGYTFENNLRDIENAKDYYLKFAEDHPDHPLREQVIISLKNLGKSPEQLIKEFQKNEQ